MPFLHFPSTTPVSPANGGGSPVYQRPPRQNGTSLYNTFEPLHSIMSPSMNLKVIPGHGLNSDLVSSARESQTLQEMSSEFGSSFLQHVGLTSQQLILQQQQLQRALYDQPSGMSSNSSFRLMKQKETNFVQQLRKYRRRSKDFQGATPGQSPSFLVAGAQKDVHASKADATTPR